MVELQPRFYLCGSVSRNGSATAKHESYRQLLNRQQISNRTLQVAQANEQSLLALFHPIDRIGQPSQAFFGARFLAIGAEYHVTFLPTMTLKVWMKLNRCLRSSARGDRSRKLSC